MTTQDNVFHLEMPDSDVKVTSVFSQVAEAMPVEEQETEQDQMETEVVEENAETAEESNSEPEEATETDGTEESLAEDENKDSEEENVTEPESTEAETPDEAEQETQDQAEPEAQDQAEPEAQEQAEPETQDQTKPESENAETEEPGKEAEPKEDKESNKKPEDESKDTSDEEKQETEKDEEIKPVEMQWTSLSSDEVDAMVGIASVRMRAMLRASATTIHEGAMNRFYGAATPHLYDSNGNLVYCILPWSLSPNGVTVSFNDYNITSASNGNLQLMAKLMYYGYGGGGNILGGYSAADQEAITHFALSYVWMILMGNTHGYGDWTSSGGSNLDGTG